MSALSRRDVLAGTVTAAVASALPAASQATTMPAVGDDSLAVIGKRLRYLRERAGMTIEQAAIAISADPAEWAKWESPIDQDGLPFIEGMRCCELLGTNHQWLCKGEDCDEAPGMPANAAVDASRLFGIQTDWLVAGENS
jgi:hypothetical protein